MTVRTFYEVCSEFKKSTSFIFKPLVLYLIDMFNFFFLQIIVMFIDLSQNPLQFLRKMQSQFSQKSHMYLLPIFA